MTSKEENKGAKSKEIEFKFESVANTQIKFVPIESTEVMFKKVRALCEILGIKPGDIEQIELRDEYYDSNSTLRDHGISFRRRIQDGAPKITLKVNQKPVDGAIYRLEDEFDCSNQEFQSFIENPMEISARLKERSDVQVTIPGKVTNIVTIINERTLLPLSTEKANYKFCYDRYYYYAEGDYSEYQTEIEIELEGEDLSDDPQLSKFRSAIEQILNYAPSRRSKLNRALERLKSGAEGIETIFTIGIDIIGYSIKTAEVQKQVIQKLNYLTKQAIRKVRGEGAERDVIYLPTGDGMIMVFKDEPDTLLPIVIDIQEEVKRYNGTHQGEKRFLFRTGLHSGQVFKYSDVNENNNFAGNGINLAQRVMSLGDAWHILATKEGFESVGSTRSQNQPYFHPIGSYPIKHGDSLEVYNVYDQDGFGNPNRPI